MGNIMVSAAAFFAVRGFSRGFLYLHFLSASSSFSALSDDPRQVKKEIYTPDLLE